MKMLKSTKIAIIGILSLFTLFLVSKVEARPGERVSFQLFYDQLAPYGEWVDDPEYGFVWLPDAGPNFMPYSSNGYWVMTKYGNTWVSNYEWGWAPFHYGRWFHTDYYGWAWVPDYEWGPAWVTWRSGGGYYGWAPLGPRMSIAVNVRIPSFHWVFVPNRYITSPYLHRYYVTHRNHVRIYNRTTIINNVYVINNKKYVSGPARRDIERSTGSRVSVRAINNSSQPNRVAVNSRSVSLYRPSIDENTRSQARPSQIVDTQTARARVAERAATANRNSAQAMAGRSVVESRAATRSNVEGREAARRTVEGREANRSNVEGREAARRTVEGREAIGARQQSRAVTGRSVTQAPANNGRRMEARQATPQRMEIREATGNRTNAREASRSRTNAREATGTRVEGRATTSSSRNNSVGVRGNNSATARTNGTATRSSGNR